MDALKNRIVVITGPRHSGKTSAARALGKILGWLTVDLDELVERQNGKSPRELFIEGPEIFRKAEALALSSLLNQAEGPLIVSAGGGLIDNEKAMPHLVEAKTPGLLIVYLEINAESAWRRVLADGELPPFLNTENPKETHFALHSRRSESYRAIANLTISAENKSPEEIAREICTRLM